MSTESTNRDSIESSSSFDSHIMKEGYLQKKGQLLKGWKKRWFVCDGRTLSYYTSHKDKKPNAVIPLATCTVQDGGNSETWNSPRIYLTESTSGTMYCLSAEEGDIVAEWLQVLHNAVLQLKGKEETNNGIILPFLPFDEEEGRGKHRSSPQKTSINRSSIHSSFPQKKKKQIPTNKDLESQLTNALQSIESLLKPSRSWTLFSCNSGVRISYLNILEKEINRNVNGNTNGNRKLFYVKGSVVVNTSPDIACSLIADCSRRSEWDLQFPYANIVATYGNRTELVHLSGLKSDDPTFKSSSSSSSISSSSKSSCCSSMILFDFSPFLTTGITAIIGWFIGSWNEFDLLISLICGGLIGCFLSTYSFTNWYKSRDLLVVKHVRKNSDNSSIILETSIKSDLMPITKQYLRAFTFINGFYIQPFLTEDDNENTLIPITKCLVTFISDLDMKGYIRKQDKYFLLLERMKSLFYLKEYIKQSKVYGEDLGLNENSNENEEILLKLGGTNSLEEDEEGDWDPSNWCKGMTRNSTGGLKLIDKEIVKKQKGVLLDVLKTFGAAILEGKSAVSLSLPVRIFEPRSILQRIVDSWIYAPLYLNKASKSTIDPIERMKLVISFAVAGLHHCVTQLKPFNPILGETYETELIDGTSIYCEHTSHHPPISNFQVFGNGYMLWGYFIISGSFKTNAITQSQNGPIYIDFEDGGRIVYNMPIMRNGGVLWGERITEFTGEMIFKDDINKLECELKFNPDEKKGMGGIFSASKTPSDHFRGILMDLKLNKEIAECQGSWLEELKFNDITYWDIEKDVFSKTIHLPNVLPSDSRYREDLQYLKKGDPIEAQEWKLKLEKLQRADRTLRKEGRKENHWANQIGH